MTVNADAKAWAALIVAILVIVENYFGVKLGPIDSNGVTDILVVIGAAIVWILPNPRSALKRSGANSE